MFILRQSANLCQKKRNRLQNEWVSPFKRRTQGNRLENAPRLIKFVKRAG